MVSMRYDHKVVPDFEQLVKLLPPDAVATPLRWPCAKMFMCERSTVDNQRQGRDSNERNRC
jgi:hypothetical protein